MKYYLAPPIWVSATAESEGHWTVPPHTLGMIDVRPRPARILAGVLGNKAYMFVALPNDAAAPAGGVLLGTGDLRTLAATGAMQDAWQAAMGYRPSGATLLELLISQVTDGADVTGETACEPLMPSGPTMELHLGGHSRIWRQRFAWGDRFTAKVAARIHHDFRKLSTRLKSEANAVRGRNAALAKRIEEHERRVLDALAEEYAVDWRDLLPPEVRDKHPGPLKHETTITESWPTTVTSTIASGQDQTWMEILNDLGVNGAGRLQGHTGSNSPCRARCQTDLSSANHYAQTEVVTLSTAANRSAIVHVRFDASADTSYRVVWQGSSGNYRLSKIEAGAAADLGTGTTQALSLPDTIKIQVSGSTLSAYFNGALVESITDMSISGHLRAGIGLNGNNTPTVELDSWEAADVVVAGGDLLLRLQGEGLFARGAL